MTAWAGRWSQTLSTTPLQPKNQNPCFWIMFNFWWSARLVEWTQTPSATSLQPKKMKCSFLDYVQLLIISLAGQWASHPICHPSPASKIGMLICGLHSTSDDRLGWLMDSNPICTTPLQPEKWNACFWITFNFWWLAGLVNALKPHLPTLSSQQNGNAHFWITFNFWWSALAGRWTQTSYATHHSSQNN